MPSCRRRGRSGLTLRSSEAHRHGTWPMRHSLSSFAPRARDRTGALRTAQTSGHIRMPPANTSSLLQAEQFLPLFFAMLLGISALLAVASGWRSLARRFPPVVQLDGERFHFASAKMGRVPWFPVNYGGCLVVTITSTGLAVSIYMPFRLLCPEFFVPWAQVESVQEQASALSRRTVVRIRGSSVWLSFRGAPGQRVLAMFTRVSTLNAA